MQCLGFSVQYIVCVCFKKCIVFSVSNQARPVSERTFGSDSGLEQSSDELEVAREVPKEGEEVEEDDLDTALESEEETVESLETGDLGVDRGTTFRARGEELDMEIGEDCSEPLPNEDDDEEEEEEEEGGDESQVSKKLATLGVNEEEAISALLSDMTSGGREVAEGRGMAGR